MLTTSKFYISDSNFLIKDFINQKRTIDMAFIDPPYNLRQYSRFYHLLETTILHDKPKLHGIALKREPENMSEYCKVGSQAIFTELCNDLSKIARFLVVTYNNTYTSKSSSSQNKISLKQLQNIKDNVIMRR